MLDFFSSHSNWDSTTSSPAGECVPPFGWGREGGHTGLRESGWGGLNLDKGTDTVDRGTLGLQYMYFVSLPVQDGEGRVWKGQVRRLQKIWAPPVRYLHGAAKLHNNKHFSIKMSGWASVTEKSSWVNMAWQSGSIKRQKIAV